MKYGLRSMLLAAGSASLAAGQDAPMAMAPVKACASLTAPALPGASVVSMNAMEMRDMNMRMPNGTAMTLSYCDVNVTLTHGAAGDRVRVEVWMPLAGWNMRFQGTGGSGFLAGLFAQALAPQVAAGYAAASTDAGLGSFGPAGLAGVNTSAPNSNQLLTNFASLSAHEMAVVGKALVQQYYGTPAKFSYWNGCSTGGRQGMMEAQTYPGDFNGILAAAPAMNWAKFVPAELWPFTAMNTAGTFPPACVFNALVAATVAACDTLDGAKDGVIANPGACNFDPQSMVGRGIACNGSSLSITAQQATVYQQILNGPVSPAGERLWYGLLPGASPTALASTTPFGLGATWVNKFVLGQQTSGQGQGASNISTAQSLNSLNAQGLATIIQQSQAQFDTLIGTDNPNLAPFKAAGGKLLTWHGLADQLIFPNGTFDYRQRVADTLGGGDAAVDPFYRVFAAPGVMHCGGGAGAAPVDPLGALVAWVESGVAPDTLPAMKMVNGTTMVMRNLCRYPFVMQYKGTGDVNAADSWTCVQGPNQQVIAETTASETSVILDATPSSASGARAALAAVVLVPLMAILALL